MSGQWRSEIAEMAWGEPDPHVRLRTGRPVSQLMGGRLLPAEDGSATQFMP
jgi:hypothetical protein